MRRLFVPLLLVLLLLPGTAQAMPAEDLASLSDYFPEETVVFATVRTDSAYLEELDVLLQTLNDNLGGEVIPPGFSAADLFDAAVIEATGLSSQIILDWAGDRAAIGVTSFEPLVDLVETGTESIDEVPVLVAIEVADRAAAEDFIRLSTEENVTETDEGDYTLFTDEETYVLVSDDVLLLGFEEKLLVEAFEGEMTALSENDTFTTTLDELPADEYNAIAYVDASEFSATLNEITEAVMEFAQEMGNPGLAELIIQNTVQLQQMETSAETIAVGLTIIDERSLVIDQVGIYGNGGLFGTTSGLMLSESEPIDPDFAEYIPANAQLVIHGTNYGGQVFAVFDALDEIGPTLQTQLDSLLELAAEEEDLMLDADEEMLLEFAEMIDLSTINFGGVTEVSLTPLFAGFTGLNLRNDVLEWMTGDYAIHASLLPVESDLDFTFDLAFLTEATDADAAANVVTRFSEALDLYELDYGPLQVDDGEAIVLTGPIRGPLVLAGLPADVLFNTPELDLVFGANEEIFVVSGRPGAEFALDPGSDPLNDDDAFVYAAETLFLDEPVSVWYVGTESLVDVLPELDPAVLSPDVPQLVALLVNVLESATITWALDEDVATARLTLTLQDDALVDLEEVNAQSQMFTQELAGRYDEVLQTTSANGFFQLGSPNAPVVVELFSSYGCQTCANFHAENSDTLIEFARTGDVVVRFIPMVTGNTIVAREGARGAYCAGQQGQYWAFSHIVFERQGDFDNQVAEALVRLADTQGLDRQAFATCLESRVANDFLQMGMSYAGRQGINATPTVLINGIRVNPTEMFDEIDRALAQMSTSTSTPISEFALTATALIAGGTGTAEAMQTSVGTATHTTTPTDTVTATHTATSSQTVTPTDTPSATATATDLPSATSTAPPPETTEEADDS